MPKCGTYEYPSRELDDCVRYLKEAHEKAKDSVMRREHFAENIDMSSKSGSFGLLTGSMVIYGLIETGEGYVKYTDLAKQILFDEPSEIERGKTIAVRRVQIFAEIFDKYGANVSDEQIRSFLRQKAEVEIQDAPRLASEIGKLFKRNAKYLKPIGGVKKEMQFKGSTLQPTGSGLFTVTSAGLTIEVDNQMKLELVKKLVEDAENQFKQMKDKKKESEKEIKGVIVRNES